MSMISRRKILRFLIRLPLYRLRIVVSLASIFTGVFILSTSYVSLEKDLISLSISSNHLLKPPAKLMGPSNPLKPVILRDASIRLQESAISRQLKPPLDYKDSSLDKSSVPNPALSNNSFRKHCSNGSNSSCLVLKDNVLGKQGSNITQTDKVNVRSLSGEIVGTDFIKEIITPSVSCAGRIIELVICVSTRRENFAKRDAIRLTWGSFGRPGGFPAHSKINDSIRGLSGEIILVFFLGSSSLTPSKAKPEQHKIEQEAKNHGDIYQAKYIDTYRNLTLKAISMHKYMTSQCPNARYLAKIDDDVYVNIPLLLLKLQHETFKLSEKMRTQNKDTLTFSHMNPHFVYGYIFEKGKPKRDKTDKWYTSEDEYKLTIYPDYLAGACYAMPGTTAQKIYHASLKIPFFWVDDVYITGICTKIANIPVLGNNYLFTIYKRKPIGCSFINSISGHGYTPLELVTIHSQLNSPSLECVGKNKKTERILMDDEEDS